MASVVHVVFFDLIGDKATIIGTINSHLEKMRVAIPGLLELHFGPQQSMYPDYVDRSHGYNYALVSRHVKPSDLEVYAKHPTHLALVAYLKTVAKRPPLALDFSPRPSKL